MIARGGSCPRAKTTATWRPQSVLAGFGQSRRARVGVDAYDEVVHPCIGAALIEVVEARELTRAGGASRRRVPRPRCASGRAARPARARDPHAPRLSWSARCAPAPLSAG